jgi:hypothetical protein
VSQNRRPAAPRRLALRWGALLLTGLAAVAVVSARPAFRQWNESRVVIRPADAMPRLDTGVAQPVHVTFVGDRQPAVGQSAGLKLVVTSGAPDAMVRTRVAAPSGASISSGRADWDGHLAYQQVAEIPVAVTFAGDKGGFVYGEVVTTLADGQTFRSATSVYVDPGTPDTPPPEPRTLVNPDGSRLDVVVWKNQ